MTADAAYWDSQALNFDDQPDHGLHDPHVRDAWRQLLLPQLPPAPAVITDLGCGTGSLTVLLAASGHTVTGMDIAPQMIKAAQAKTAAAGVSAQFLISDAAAPALPAGRFDVVLARHVLWAMPDIDVALDQWVRLLKPSGALVLVEGRWQTGVGLTSAQAEQAVHRHRTQVTVTPLNSPLLWGGPVTDERYLLTSAR